MIALMLCIGYSKHTKVKKLFIVTIIMIALLSAVCLSAGAQTYLRGDADGDGSITSLDTAVVQRVVSGIDFDEDGCIAQRAAVADDPLSIQDATRIQMFLAHFDDRYRIGDRVDTAETPTEAIMLPTEDNQLPILRG